ncbi:MAG: DUF2752 domain-containing protein [Planctomycetota bacterium]|jgi:hypothetical protein
MNCTNRRAREPETSRTFYVNRILVILVCTGILLASFLLGSTILKGPVVCPSHGIMGVPCPACGLTRAFCAVGEADISSALAFNAICIPLLILFVFAPFIAAWEIFAGRRLDFYGFIYSVRLAYVFGAAVAIYHVARFSCWIYDGTLYSQYIKTSWTYNLFFQ